MTTSKCPIRSRLDGLIAMYDSLNGAELTEEETRCANELESVDGSVEILMLQDKEKYQQQARILCSRIHEAQRVEHLQKRLYEVQRRTRDCKLDSQTCIIKISESEATLKRLQNARQQQAEQLNNLTRAVVREREHNRILNEELTKKLNSAQSQLQAEVARSKLLQHEVNVARVEAGAELKRLRDEYNEAAAGVRAAQAEQRSMAVRLGGLRYEQQYMREHARSSATEQEQSSRFLLPTYHASFEREEQREDPDQIQTHEKVVQLFDSEDTDMDDDVDASEVCLDLFECHKTNCIPSESLRVL